MSETLAGATDILRLRDGSWIVSRHGLTWRATPNLRWRTIPQPGIGEADLTVLEQAWQCVEHAAVRWERVPTVSSNPERDA